MEHRDMPVAVTPQSLGLVFRANLVKNLITQTNQLLQRASALPATLDIELKHLHQNEFTFYREHFEMAGWVVRTQCALDQNEEYVERLQPIFNYVNKE